VSPRSRGPLLRERVGVTRCRGRDAADVSFSLEVVSRVEGRRRGRRPTGPSGPRATIRISKKKNGGHVAPTNQNTHPSLVPRGTPIFFSLVSQLFFYFFCPYFSSSFGIFVIACLFFYSPIFFFLAGGPPRAPLSPVALDCPFFCR